MGEASGTPKKARFSRARGLVRSGQNLVFNILVGVAGLAGLGVAALGLGVLAEGSLFGLLLIAVSVIPMSFPIVVYRERRRDKTLTRFLIENLERLEAGVVGPEGAIYTLDTVMVSYQAMFSAVVVSLKSESGLYLHGRSHKLPKTLYTLFTVLFGWWAASWEVWVDNIGIIGKNLKDSNQVTVRQLLGLDEAVADDEGAPLDPARLPG